MSRLFPGKGIHTDATWEMLSFIHDAMNEIHEVASPSENDGGVNQLIDENEAEEFLTDLSDTFEGWTAVSDKFGKKLYKAIDWKEGAVRVTVVVTKQGELKLDIRQWYNPDAS